MKSKDKEVRQYLSKTMKQIGRLILEAYLCLYPKGEWQWVNGDQKAVITMDDE